MQQLCRIVSQALKSMLCPVHRKSLASFSFLRACKSKQTGWCGGVFLSGTLFVHRPRIVAAVPGASSCSLASVARSRLVLQAVRVRRLPLLCASLGVLQAALAVCVADNA
jgi:hypothetical protein